MPLFKRQTYPLTFCWTESVKAITFKILNAITIEICFFKEASKLIRGNRPFTPVPNRMIILRMTKQLTDGNLSRVSF